MVQDLEWQDAALQRLILKLVDTETLAPVHQMPSYLSSSSQTSLELEYLPRSSNQVEAIVTVSRFQKETF